MKNWENRKLIHWDGNDRCIKLSKSLSLGFDTFIFYITFSTLFQSPKKGKLAKGSMYWETLSFKDKLFNSNHGLIKLFKCNYYYSESPYHGVNTWFLKICFLPFVLHKYYDEKEFECDCVETCGSI